MQLHLRLATIAGLSAVLSACAAAPAPPRAPAPGGTLAAAAAPARDPGRDNLPLVADLHAGASTHSFQGGDDHVTLALDNRGRDIQDLVVDGPAWLSEHDGFAMGTSRSCEPDLDTGRVHCGPVYAGQSAAFILRTFPAHVGSFHYELRVLDQEGGALLPITGSDGAPLRFTYDEVVDPVTNQIPGGNLPSPAPTG